MQGTILSVMHRRLVRSIGSVCALAFVGTTISTFAVGGLMYAFGAAGWCKALPLIHNLLFGALISATDPVRAA